MVFFHKEYIFASPRRLRAKYTLRTNLRFVLWVFRPCREQSHASVTYTNAVAFEVVPDTAYGTKTVIKAEDTADVATTLVTEVITEPEPPIITATIPETKTVEQPKPQIPPRPVMPPEAAAFPRLQKIKVTLDKQNHLIFEAERERNKLEIELSDLRGLARPFLLVRLVF